MSRLDERRAHFLARRETRGRATVKEDGRAARSRFSESQSRVG
jgi:hypothetical protein